MTDYPKDDWRNAIPESDEYDREELIAFRIQLSKRAQNDADFIYVMSMSTKTVNAYCKLCEAWVKQFGEQEKIEPKVENPAEKVEEPKDLKKRIQHRLDRLETFMKENKRDEATLLEPEISKFWSILGEEDKDFIQCVRIALKDDLDWNAK